MADQAARNRYAVASRYPLPLAAGDHEGYAYSRCESLAEAHRFYRELIAKGRPSAIIDTAIPKMLEGSESVYLVFFQ